MTKDELRAELARQAQQYQDVYGGEVRTYAAQPEPDRRPWKKRTSVQAEAFQKVLDEAAQLKVKRESQEEVPT